MTTPRRDSKKMRFTSKMRSRKMMHHGMDADNKQAMMPNIDSRPEHGRQDRLQYRQDDLRCAMT
jgi:hypothetical protein